jgi:hypothetical protein
MTIPVDIAVRSGQRLLRALRAFPNVWYRFSGQHLAVDESAYSAPYRCTRDTVVKYRDSHDCAHSREST